MTSKTSSNIGFDLIDLSPKPVNASDAIKSNFSVNNFNVDNKQVICVSPKLDDNYNYDNYQNFSFH